MGRPFCFDRTWELDVTPDALFALLGRTDDFVRWWSWLRRCEAHGLQPGTAARCTVQAPLPYALHFDVHVERVVTPSLVATRVSGDLVGPARLEVARRGSRSAARLVWELELHDPVLRRLERLARPAMTWAHDRVVDMGVSQFERRALDGDGRAPASG